MKKVLILLVMILLLSGCSKTDKTEKVLKELGIDDECTLEKVRNTHGGFHGDGEYFSKIKCDSIEEEELSDKWKKYPLSDELDMATNMDQCDSNDCKSIYEKYNIPKNISTAFYYFKDRHPDARNEYSDVNVNNRASYNYTIAILDVDNSTIYYYELDT